MGGLVPSALKALLLVILWGLFLFWVVEWFLYPTDRWTSWKADAIEETNSKFLELNGPFFLMWSFPRVELYRCAKVEASMAKTPNATYPSEKSAGGAHGSGLTCHFVRRVCNHVDFREALDPYA